VPFNFKNLFLSCSVITESFLRSVNASVQYNLLFTLLYLYPTVQVSDKAKYFKQYFI